MSAYVSNLSVPLLLAYEDVNDAERLCRDPVRWIAMSRSRRIC